MKRIGLFGLFLLCLSLSDVRSEMISRVAAVVNEDIITTHQLDTALQEKLASMDRRPSPAQLSALRRELLSRMIDETLIQQRIRALNLTVSEEEVETAILDVQKQNQLSRDDLKAAVLTQGMTFEDYRDNLRKQILRYKLISTEVRSQVDVSEKEVLDYYRNHIDDYRYPPTLTLSALAFPVSQDADTFQREAVVLAANEAYTSLQNGDPLDSVVTTFTQNNAFVTDLGTFAYGEIAPEFVEATRDLEVGSFARPVTKADVVYVLRLDDREEGGLRKFDAVKTEIYQLIMDQKIDARLKQWTKALEKQAFIDVRL